MLDDPVHSSRQQAAESIALMAEIRIDENNFDAVARLISELAGRTLVPGDGVSITLDRNGTLVTAAHTQDFAKKIDDRQYEDGAGPCVTATRSGNEVHSFPLDLEKWPGLRAAAEESGVRGVYSLPLQVHPAPMGALNLYSKAPAGPSDDEAELARAFARQAAIVLANAVAYAEAAAHVEQLKEGLRSREVIGQAKGILMERERCSADDAFEMLRQLSMRTNVKLRDVAEKIVASAEERRTGLR